MPVDTGHIPDDEAEAMAAAETQQVAPDPGPAPVVATATAPTEPPPVDPGMPGSPLPADLPDPEPTIADVNPSDVLVGEQETPTGPPPAVAGVEVLEAEAGGAQAGDTDRSVKAPWIDVRGRRFPLRSSVPGMTLLRLTKTQSQMQSSQNPDGSVDERKGADAMGVLFDAMTKLVKGSDKLRDPATGEPLLVEDGDRKGKPRTWNPREEFVAWCEDAEPEIEMKELTQDILGTMIATISGRPT